MQQAQEAGWTRDAVKAARAANLEFQDAFRAHIHDHPWPKRRRIVFDPLFGEFRLKSNRLKKPSKKTSSRDANRGP
jgi:hypothetical protein